MAPGSSDNEVNDVDELQVIAKVDRDIMNAIFGGINFAPWDECEKMLKELQMMEEADAEAEHSDWCGTQLAAGVQTREEKTESVETLRAEIDQLEARCASTLDRLQRQRCWHRGMCWKAVGMPLDSSVKMRQYVSVLCALKKIRSELMKL